MAQSLIAQRPLINEKRMLEEAATKEQDVCKTKKNIFHSLEKFFSSAFMIAVREEQVRENYEEQLKKIRHETNRFESLWNFYLNFCLERLQKASDADKSEVREEMK